MKVLIIGCGWLGLPLGKKLAEAGMTISGTTTRQEKLVELELNGIASHLFRGLEDLGYLKKVISSADWVILTIPPSGAMNYPDLIHNLVVAFPSTCNIIFTSSIGVYQPTAGLVNEEATCLSDHPVYCAEEVIRKIAPNRSVVLRLGGLFGSGRHPIKFLAGRSEIAQGNAPVNLVHLKDVVEAIEVLIGKKQFSGTYNLVFPDHPTKEFYYQEKANQLGLLKPVYKTDDTVGKIVVADKIVKDLGFKYSHDLWTEF
jgi:nucleoside-diphosphate-sugar epimerase